MTGKKTGYLSGGHYSINDRSSIVCSSNGGKVQETQYQRGMPHGVHRCWHDNGEPSFRVRFENRLREGRATSWNAAGDETQIEHYEAGKLNGVQLREGSGTVKKHDP